LSRKIILTQPSADPADRPGSTNKHRCKGRDVKKTTRFVGTNTTGF